MSVAAALENARQSVPTLAMLSKVTNTGKGSRSPSMINDGEDREIPRTRPPTSTGGR